MKITTTGRKINVTDGLRSYVEKKISKLGRFFSDDANVQVTLSVQKDDHIVEVTIYHEGMIFRAEIRDTDMYAAIDKVVDVLERQIRKQKTKLEKRLKSGAFSDDTEFVPIDEEEEFKVVKVKKYENKPMSVDEAILQMNLLGHEFYIFNNSETMDKEVVYKRKDGNYGLIELS
ncbi:MAG: ribosome-associated translation inhibitor RaiA [Ruminococcaceae bacterium]|nr:ribosome-associated translation inhibitor RaiA [Oscillospiraceae bacterium]